MRTRMCTIFFLPLGNILFDFSACVYIIIMYMFIELYNIYTVGRSVYVFFF